MAAPRGYGKDGIYSITVATAVTAFILEAGRAVARRLVAGVRPDGKRAQKKSGESP